MQRGNIRKQHGSWHLRYYVSEIKDGMPVRRRVTKVLAPVNDQYRSPKDVRQLAEEILSPLNLGRHQPEGGLSLSEFIEKYFLPHVLAKRKPSTHKFYKEVYQNHLRERVGDIRLRDFTTRHAQDVLDSISLSHQSLLRIKTGMSAVFTFARQRDFIRHANPVQGAKAEGSRSNPKRYAYTTKEIKFMLKELGEPARSVVAVAAFTGLRAGEIRGLRWDDFTGEELIVRRAIWRTHVGETKTEDSAAAVPVIPLLGKILKAHRLRYPGNGYIFAGDKKGFALHLDNLSRRDLAPALGARWKGWHAFRRGLATNLYTLGIQPKVIQGILRHARVETTTHHYVMIESKSAGRAAMREIEKVMGRKRGAAKPARRTKPA